MRDILERLRDSSPHEEAHELQCRCFDAADEIERLRKLAASLLEAQAREKALRDALIKFSDTFTWNPDYVLQARIQPPDDTALKQLLAAERERCAKAAEAKYPKYDGTENYCFDTAQDCADAIRALGD